MKPLFDYTPRIYTPLFIYIYIYSFLFIYLLIIVFFISYIAFSMALANPVSLYLCNDSKDFLFCKAVPQASLCEAQRQFFRHITFLCFGVANIHSFAPFPTCRFLHRALEKDSDSDTWIIGRHLKGVRASRSSPFTLLLAPRPIRPLWGAQEREGMIEIKGIVGIILMGLSPQCPLPRQDLMCSSDVVVYVCVVKWSFNES